MDIVEKFIAGHSDIRERWDLLSKLSRSVDNDVFFWDNANKVSAFFKKELREHLELEEKVLFPVLRSVLPADKVPVLDAIEREHGPLREKLAYFEEVSKGHNRFPSKVTREEMAKTIQDLLSDLAAHAGREDKELFPLMKGNFKDEQYKELERRYFKFLGA